jgi:hypothetical protein
LRYADYAVFPVGITRTGSVECLTIFSATLPKSKWLFRPRLEITTKSALSLSTSLRISLAGSHFFRGFFAPSETLRSEGACHGRWTGDGGGQRFLVPGDMIVMVSGDKVPADLRLVSSEELRVEEAMFMGTVVLTLEGGDLWLPWPSSFWPSDRRNSLPILLSKRIWSWK